jgi:hypothetical protein
MSSEINFDIIQTSRRFFGYALGHTPEELYKHSNKPKPLQLGVLVTDYLIHKAVKNELFSRKELRPIGLLFTEALDNTHSILMQEMHERNIPLEFVPLIARDERTITNIARLAMHGQGVIQTMLNATKSKDYFGLSEDMTHVQATNNLVDTATGGCPFATSPQRTPSPDPLFRRTIHLAGDLTYLSYKK